MGIGSITSTNRMPAVQTSAADLKGQKSKNIQNEITNTQQQIRKLSSKEDLSENEKTNKRRELQKEISGLNAELKQYQDELSKSQKREFMMAELQESRKPAKEEKSDGKMQTKEADSNSAEQENPATDSKQTARPGTVITQNSDGTVILKESSNPDQKTGVDTESDQDGGSREKAIGKQEQEKKDDDITADANLSGKEMHAMAAAESSLQQADRLGTVVAKIRNGIAILKGEISQDENLGADTAKKEAELEKMEKQAQRATAVRFSILGEANNAAKSTAETSAQVNGGIQANTENIINAFNPFSEEQMPQPKFYVSIG